MQPTPTTPQVRTAVPAVDAIKASQKRQQTRSVAAMLIVLLAITFVVPWIANAYWIKTLTSAMALSVAAAGIAVLYGQLGLVSLCQYALLGVGGWVALRVSHAWGLPFELCVLFAGVCASLTGIVAGLPALRLKGLYLALVTLMMAGGYQVVAGSVGFPDGGPGWLGRVVGSERHLMVRPSMATSDTAYFVYVMVWLTGVLLAIELHRRSRPGRSWALIRQGEVVAMATGVNILAYQSWAFALAGFCAGISGALLAGGVGQLDGRSFAASESLMLFALTVIAGVYHWSGALIAGLLLRAAPALLNDFEVNAYVATLVFGAALLHTLITAPQGISGQWLGLLRHLGSIKRNRGNGFD